MGGTVMPAVVLAYTHAHARARAHTHTHTHTRTHAYIAFTFRRGGEVSFVFSELSRDVF